MQAQNEDLKKKVAEQDGQIKRLAAEYENKVGILKGECQRLNSLLENRNSEIKHLGSEVEQANQGLRLSSQNTHKLTNQLNDFKNRLGQSNDETQTYKQKLQKMLGENSALVEEVREAQENLRLSAGTMNKLQN